MAAQSGADHLRHLRLPAVGDRHQPGAAARPARRLAADACAVGGRAQRLPRGGQRAQGRTRRTVLRLQGQPAGAGGGGRALPRRHPGRAAAGHAGGRRQPVGADARRGRRRAGRGRLLARYHAAVRSGAIDAGDDGLLVCARAGGVVEDPRPQGDVLQLPRLPAQLAAVPRLYDRARPLWRDPARRAGWRARACSRPRSAAWPRCQSR
jgi:hypothetical protein